MHAKQSKADYGIDDRLFCKDGGKETRQGKYGELDGPRPSGRPKRGNDDQEDDAKKLKSLEGMYAKQSKADYCVDDRLFYGDDGKDTDEAEALKEPAGNLSHPEGDGIAPMEAPTLIHQPSPTRMSKGPGPDLSDGAMALPVPTSPTRRQREAFLTPDAHPCPGALAVPGCDGTDDDEDTGTVQYRIGDSEDDDVEAPLTAEPVDEATDEEIRRLREMFENVAVAQVVDAPDVDEQHNHEGDNELDEPERMEEADNEAKEQRSFVDCSSKRSRWIAGVVILLVILAIGAVLAVVLKPEPDPTPPSEELIALLASVSSDGGTNLKTASTPQNKAINWLANNDNLNSYNNETKIQRYALATFYYSTGGGDAWTNDDLWLDNGEECNRWVNISDDERENLEKMKVRKNKLNGSIPTNLGRLTNVDYLSLADNSLSGTIPSEIGQLNKLVRLILYSNSLSGTIPSEIGLLTSLITLYLENNRLTGTIPSEIYSMTLLDDLKLIGNNFTGGFVCPHRLETCDI